MPLISQRFTKQKNKTLFKAAWGYILLLNAGAITFPLFPLNCFCQLLNFWGDVTKSFLMSSGVSFKG